MIDTIWQIILKLQKLFDNYYNKFKRYLKKRNNQLRVKFNFDTQYKPSDYGLHLKDLTTL